MIGTTLIAKLGIKRWQQNPFWRSHWRDYVTASIIGVVLVLVVFGWIE